MKLRYTKAIALVLALICLLWIPASVSAVSQGTDGTELQVIQPSDLEIHLGPEWTGAEFSLETDAGTYPGTIPVGEDGVLRLEIGGSERYILTRLNPTSVLPAPGDSRTETNEIEDGTEPSGDSIATEADSHRSSNDVENATGQGSAEAIPAAHLVLFVGGLIAALCTLAGIHFNQNRKSRIDDSDDDF